MGRMRRPAHQIPFPEASPAARRPSPEDGAPDPPSKRSQAHRAFEATRVRSGAAPPHGSCLWKTPGSNYLLFGEQGSGFCDHRDPENKQDVIYTLKKHLPQHHRRAA